MKKWNHEHKTWKEKITKTGREKKKHEKQNRVKKNTTQKNMKKQMMKQKMMKNKIMKKTSVTKNMKKQKLERTKSVTMTMTHSDEASNATLNEPCPTDSSGEVMTDEQKKYVETDKSLHRTNCVIASC